ncbi:MAG: SUMF1/EgtB/PvdO family nonheme iron enzyme, partial [Candidatus Hydrogenedentota bacterium]
PYAASDGREATDSTEKRVIRGGSWYDRPAEATSAYRYAYHAWQKIYNVGFRIIVRTH